MHFLPYVDRDTNSVSTYFSICEVINGSLLSFTVCFLLKTH